MSANAARSVLLRYREARRRPTAWSSLARRSLLVLAAVPDVSDDEARRKAAEILARPEFSRKNWLLDLQNEIATLLGGLFRWLSGLYVSNPLLYWLILVICVVLLVVLLGHIGWTLSTVLRADRRLAGIGSHAAERSRLSAKFREEARLAAAREDFTEAIRCLFLALVYRLDESGRVLFQRSLTNREYLALFADRPKMHASLSVYVDAIDDLWYGQRPADRRLYEDCLARFDTVV